MAVDDWLLVGAPWDSSGTGRAEQDAPDALRAAGLTDLVGLDLGDAATPIRTSERDHETGVRALADTVRAAHALADVLTPLLQDQAGRRLLVVGGDCSLLLGVFPALRRTLGRVGLALVDGHPDYLDGAASDTGETADMELAVLTGRGHAVLAELAGPPPMVAVDDAVLLGHRTTALDEASAAEVARLPDALTRIDAAAVIEDATRAGELAAALLGDRCERYWVHIDLDVLDEQALPAVTYPQPDGPGCNQLAALIRPLLAHPGLVGLSLADFRPDLDPEGAYARRMVELLRQTMS